MRAKHDYKADVFHEIGRKSITRRKLSIEQLYRQGETDRHKGRDIIAKKYANF